MYVRVTAGMYVAGLQCLPEYIYIVHCILKIVRGKGRIGSILGNVCPSSFIASLGKPMKMKCKEIIPCTLSFKVTVDIFW